MKPNAMRDLLGWMAAAALTGCAGDLGPAPEAGPIAAALSSPSFEVFPPSDDICSWRRAVAYMPGQVCTAASGWIGLPLFQGAGPTETELKRYCVYQWSGSGEPTLGERAALPQGSAPDCLVVVPLEAQAWETIHNSFQEQIDLPELEAAPPPAPRPVRSWVAVVDSSPRSPTGDGEAVPGNFPHGYVLGRIIREAACPEGRFSDTPCTADVHHELALAHTFDGTSWTAPPGGGRFGRQSELATAIHRSVRAFFQSRSDPKSHLVVNLSVGWLEAYGGNLGDVAGEKPPVRAVYAAIQHAVCKGGVVFAAAGNLSGGTLYTNGPVYPARWTTRPGPDPAKCAGFGGTAWGYKKGGRLVEAVGGVDGRDHIISIARPLGTPAIVAPSVLGAVSHPDGEPGPALTGTSVGTAVASAAAAVAWAYAPELDQIAAARWVHESGPSLDMPAESMTCNGDCRMMRRVSICAAVQKACADLGSGPHPRCVPFACADRPAFADARPVLYGGMYPPPDLVLDIGSFVAVTEIPLACGSIEVYRPPGSVGPGSFPCPDRQFYSGAAHPGVGGQPGDAGCRHCTYQRTAAMLTLHIELDPDQMSTPLHLPTLLLKTRGDAVTTTRSFALWESLDPAGHPIAFQGNQVYSLSLVLPPFAGPIENARLSGTDADDKSWTADVVPLTGP